MISRTAVANYQHIVAVGTSSRSWWLAKSESARPARRGRSDSSNNQNIAIGGVLWPWTNYGITRFGIESPKPVGQQSTVIFRGELTDASNRTSRRYLAIERVTRDNRWNSPASSPSTIDDNAPREPRIPLRLSGTNSFKYSSVYSQGYFTAGRPRIIELARANGARFIHTVYGSWPILGCTADTRPMERSE